MPIFSPAVLELLQAGIRPGTLAIGEDLAEVLLEQFEDRRTAGSSLPATITSG